MTRPATGHKISAMMNTYPPRVGRRNPVRRHPSGLWMPALLVHLLVGCENPRPAPVDLGELEQVERPADLEALDAAVQEQLAALWKDLENAGDKPPALAAAWGALGRWFDVYHYADSAGRCYRNAHRLAPREPRWPYHMGVLATKSGDSEAARDYLSRAAEAAPDETAPRVRLGDLALERQDLDEAARHYDAVAAQNPADPGALFGHGRLALLRDRPRAAVEILEALLRDQPEASQAHYSLALAWRLLGDETKAAEHMAAVPEDNLEQIAVALDAPWDRELQSFDRGARTLTRRGVRAARRGEHQQAAVLFGTAVGADPNGPEERINYGLALHRVGRPAEARREFEKALELSEPGSELRTKSHLELGRLLGAVGRPVEALEHLQAALRIDPRSTQTHIELGRLHHKQGNLEAALTHYAAAREDASPWVEVAFWHGAVMSMLGRRDAAADAVEQDLARLGEDRDLLLLAVRLASTAPSPSADSLRQAQRRLDRATELGPIDVHHAESAAMLAAAQGRFGDAVSRQEAAVETLATLKRRRVQHAANRRLALYRNAEPCSVPWEPTEGLVTLPVSPTSSEGRP